MTLGEQKITYCLEIYLNTFRVRLSAEDVRGKTESS